MTMVSLMCVIATVALALPCAAELLYRIDFLSLPNAFALLQWGAYAGLTAMATALFTGGMAYGRRERRGMALAGVAFLAGLVAVTAPVWALSGRRPIIYDTFSDLGNHPHSSPRLAGSASRTTTSCALTAWGSGTRVDVPSVSRVGLGDTGRERETDSTLPRQVVQFAGTFVFSSVNQLRTTLSCPTGTAVEFCPGAMNPMNLPSRVMS